MDTPIPVKSDSPAIVLFSGGQDSTTCLHWAMRRFSAVEGLFFDYGQRHIAELDAALRISRLTGVPLKVLDVDVLRQIGNNALVDGQKPIESKEGELPSTFVPGRNILFLTCAASYAYVRGVRDLVTGVCQTDYSGYPDCRDETIRSLEKTLNLGLGLEDSLRIHTPLMHLTKAETVAMAVELGAMDSLIESHTCYNGTYPPCGECPACVLRQKGFDEAGIPDPLFRRGLAGRGTEGYT